ncbi:TorF family putative porin [Massilia niastensis]|uniref:TorF family putative porin n=1 Tax=Massilia niastensis TaxID=544911 RepID=UPI000A067C8E|nr:TorF family putative porin [Massilia niastensis]
MRKLVLAICLSTIGSGALADEANQSPHQVTGTVSAVSDYIFRGVTQTWHRPALQGSIDYAHASGLFAGLWASTISEKVVAGADAEIDLALGYRGTVNGNWSYGAGVMTVYYPGGNWNRMKWGDKPDQKYDFTEANVFLGYKWLNAKYARTLTDLLGFNENTGFSGSTKGADYIEINADIPLADTGLVLGLHAGRQDFKARLGTIKPIAKDYRISLSKSFAGGWIAAAQVSRNTNIDFFNGTRSNMNENDTCDVGRRRFVLTLTRLF